MSLSRHSLGKPVQPLSHVGDVLIAKIARFFFEASGLRATAGALCQASQSTSSALVPVTNIIRQRINDSPVVAMDETGWRNKGLVRGSLTPCQLHPHQTRCL